MSGMTRPMTLAELIQATVTEHKEGVQGVAELLEKHLQSVYAEISPSPLKNNAKLGVLDWIKILKHTGDLRSLHKVAEMVDNICVPIPHAAPGKKDGLAHIAAITKEVGDAVSLLAQGLAETSEAGSRLSKNERAKTRAEVFEAIQALGALYVDLGD